YDAMWNLAGVCHPGGGRTEYVYDQRNRLIRETDPEGNATEYGYDAAGNRIFVRGADGSAVHAVYDAKRRITAVTDRDGNTTQYTYDGQGNLIFIRDAAGGERRMEYDGAGQKISETDALGNTTRYEYNALGQPSCILDAKGRATRHMYAPGGRLIKTTYPDGTEETYDYDPSGRVAEKKTRNGQTVTYRYDLIGRLTETDSSGGGTETYEYDGMDRIARITDALGNVTHYAYDGNGNLTRVTDALGNETCYTYDGMGDLLTVTRYEGKAGSGGKEERTVYQRDLCGRVTAMTDPLGQTETYAYDPYGRMIRKCDRDGNETRYAYTPGGKLAELLYGDGRKASYHYDPLGALTQVTDWLGTTRMENDALGRVLRVTDPYGKEVAYEWGSTGERKKLTYPDGQEALYRYNEAGQLSELAFGAGSIRYGYDGAGRLCRKQFPNGVTTEYTYDNTGHLEKISHTGKDIEESYSYRYDPAGNKIEACKQRPGMDMDSGSFRYGYDALHRLTQVSRDGRLLRSYGYDAFGNRTRKEEYIGSAPVRTSYFYNVNNQLTAQSNGEEERTYTYDGRGNLTAVSRGEELLQTFTYDTANRMSSAVRYEAGKTAGAFYQYNGLNQRMGKGIYTGDKAENTNVQCGVRYTLDLTRRYHNLLDADDRIRQRKQNYYWDGNIVGLTENGTEGYYLQDDLGSVVNLMDKEGKSLEDYAYDEYGVPMQENDRQPFGYTGYQYDGITGSYFAQAREYSPYTGSFVSKDNDMFLKLGQPESFNQYLYCKANPLIYIDPSGFDSYIFYTTAKKSDFSSQAEWKKEQLLESGETEDTIHMIEVLTISDFEDGWNNMGEDGTVDIDNVYIYSHGTDRSLIFESGSTENAMSIDGLNTGDEPIGNLNDLEVKKITYGVELYSCNAGSMAAYKTVGENVASVLSTKVEDGIVYGYDGNVAFGKGAWMFWEHSYEDRLSHSQRGFHDIETTYKVPHSKPKGKLVYMNGEYKKYGYFPNTSFAPVKECCE
ncbi:MAG: hypothetical protein K2O73_05225, partial [Lachnospiraceae bacterium]|nr:hypothetical protein [Lachnospiraceae bacterium]